MEPIRLHPSWTSRPKLNKAEWSIFHDFTGFASLCGGEPSPQALQAWLEMTEVADEDRQWVIKVYTSLSSVVREPVEKGEQ